MNPSNNDEGPELRSIRMSSASSSSEPSIAFSTPFITEKQLQIEQEEPISQPLHTQEWNLPEELPAIPSDYVLGYSHALVPQTNPQIIANRIIQGLAKHSVAFCVHESRPNTLLAEATCGLKIAVNLFRCPTTDNDGTMVEVERRIGCSYGFHICSTAILKAAKGLCDSQACSSSKSLEVPKCIPLEAQQERQKSIAFDIDQALELVHSERTDAQLLGLESLERLSLDPFAASLLHTNETIGSIQTFLLNDNCVTKRRALGILANILRLQPDRCSKLECQHFLGKLVEAVHNSTFSPHEACAATKCLQSMELPRDKKEDLAMLLQNFHAHHHLQLAQESKVLQEQLRRK